MSANGETLNSDFGQCAEKRTPKKLSITKTPKWLIRDDFHKKDIAMCNTEKNNKYRQFSYEIFDI